MTYSVLLFNTGQNGAAPSWWTNFASTCDGNGSVRIDSLNTKLMDYAAHFHCTGQGGSKSWGDRYIDFYDERAYAWFVLRWS